MRIIFGLLFILSACGTATQKDTASFKDLEPLVGNWAGTQHILISDDKTKVSYPTSSVITALKDSIELNFTVTLSDGQESEKGLLSIYKDGNKLLMGASEYDIQDVKRSGDELTITALKEDEDNDKPAGIRLTINIQPKKLVMTREVKYKGTDKYFTRIKLDLAKK